MPFNSIIPGPPRLAGSVIPFDVNTFSTRFTHLQDRINYTSLLSGPGVIRASWVRQVRLLSGDWAKDIPEDLSGDDWLAAMESLLNRTILRNKFLNRVRWIEYSAKILERTSRVSSSFVDF